MYIDNSLKFMQKLVEINYDLLINKEISKAEYLWRVKFIDEEITRLEMAILQDKLDLKESSLLYIPKPKR